MSWAVIIQLIAQYGLPMAELLWKKWTAGGVPTQNDWDELKALGSQSARSQLIGALTRAAVPLDSPQAIALLALVP